MVLPSLKRVENVSPFFLSFFLLAVVSQHSWIYPMPENAVNKFLRSSSEKVSNRRVIVAESRNR